jgi:hypothetical protein
MAAGTPALDSQPPRMSQMAVAARWLGITALNLPVLAFALSYVGELACGLSFRKVLDAHRASVVGTYVRCREEVVLSPSSAFAPVLETRSFQ